ncbi:MAG: hypothetical protein ACEQSA_01360 [Weeksellaceae bacterium]
MFSEIKRFPHDDYALGAPTQLSEADTLQKVYKFEDTIYPMDGELIPLTRRTLDGEPLHLAVRYLPSAHREKHPRHAANPEHFMLVDMYAGDDTNIHPIGYSDWKIDGDHAIASISYHSVPLPATPHEELLLPKWKQINLKGLQVDPDYQGQGIGMFMQCVSLRLFAMHDITTITLVDMLEPSKRLWQKLGLDEGYHVVRYPVEELPNQLLIDETIKSFVG